MKTASFSGDFPVRGEKQKKNKKTRRKYFFITIPIHKKTVAGEKNDYKYLFPN
jgi:hypothetical protein